jgi:hypothetical protein
MVELKRIPASKVKWTAKFLEVVPAVDADGKPLQQDPPLNLKGFWDKPNPGLNISEEKDVKRKR